MRRHLHWKTFITLNPNSILSLDSDAVASLSSAIRLSDRDTLRTMAAKYILAVLGGLFLIAGSLRLTHPQGRSQARTWLAVGGIFALVSLVLFLTQ